MSNTRGPTTGHGLRRRVEARKGELQASLHNSTLHPRVRLDVESVLAEIQGLLTGDLDHIPRVVAAELNTWLEANEHLDKRHEATRDEAYVPLAGRVWASG